MNNRLKLFPQPFSILWEKNVYARFGYGPHEILYHTQGQVSVPMNDNPTNVNKQVNNQ